MSLVTQKENTDIITIVNLARITHKKYIRLEKIYFPHPENIFEQMPILKDFLSNIDDQNRCQGATLKNLKRGMEYLERDMSSIIQYIIKCSEQRNGDLMDEVDEDATNTAKETTEGCYHTFVKFSTAKFSQRVNKVEEVIMKQFSSVKAIDDQYCQMPIFQDTSFQ